jgi:hypothetical protein
LPTPVKQPAYWILEGAFALEVRLGLATRATKDIDLARIGDEQSATAHLTAAAAIDLGDFFSFDVRRTPALDNAAGFHAVRYTVRAELAGRRYEQFPVDVALGERLAVEADQLAAPHAGHHAATALSNPILSSVAAGRWNPAVRRWQ